MEKDWTLEESIRHWRNQGAPQDQQALIGLLCEVQQQNGAVSRGNVGEIAQAYAIPPTMLLAMIRRIPTLRLLESRHELEICGNASCSGKGSLALLEWVRKTYPDDERFTLVQRNCLKKCGKGPAIRWDGRTFEKADQALLKQLIEEDR